MKDQEHLPKYNDKGALAVTFAERRGYRASWAAAEHYLERARGVRGRICTMVDIVDARLNTPVGSPAWRFSYVTDSRIYVGVDSRGKLLALIMHGCGPKGSRDRHDCKPSGYSGGYEKISHQMFIDITLGHYGPYESVDFDSYVDRKEGADDPLLRYAIGPRYEEFAARHRQETDSWLMGKCSEAEIASAPMLECRVIGWPKSLSEQAREADDQAAIVYPLVMNGIRRFEADDRSPACAVTEIEYQWHDEFSVRQCVAATTAYSFYRIQDIVPPVDVLHDEVVLKNATALLNVNASQAPAHHLLKVDEDWYIQHLRAARETGEIAHAVTAIAQVGERRHLKFKVHRPYNESPSRFPSTAAGIECPAEANAVWIVPNTYTETGSDGDSMGECDAVFFRIEADFRRRLPSKIELEDRLDDSIELLKRLALL